MSKRKKRYIIPIFIPQEGCPFNCIYCDQYAITGVEKYIFDDVKKTLEHSINLTSPSQELEIAFYGGTFTAMNEDLQRCLLEMAASYRESGRKIGIRLSTRPDYIDERVMNMLSSYGVTTIELGAQSMDDNVLKSSGRGHTAYDIIKAAHLVKDYGIELGIQLMIGLPGDNKDKDMFSLFKAINLGADFVRIYPTLVIKGTPLERLYIAGQYKPLSLFEAVDICADMYCACVSHNVVVIRMGLQPSDGIQLGRNVIAGPFYPAFGELVRSRVYLEMMIEFLQSVDYNKNDVLVIESCQRDLSVVIGQKKQNIDMLKKSTGLHNIKIEASSEINSGYLRFCLYEMPDIINHNPRIIPEQRTVKMPSLIRAAKYISRGTRFFDLSIKDYCYRRCVQRYRRYVS